LVQQNSKFMSGLFLTVRAVAIFLSFSLLIGMIWYIDYLSRVEAFAGLFSVFTGFLVAITPRHRFNEKSKKSLYLIFCLLGILSLSVLLFGDITNSHGVDWGGVIMNLLFLVCFITITYEIAKKRGCIFQIDKTPG